LPQAIDYSKDNCAFYITYKGAAATPADQIVMA